MEALRTENISKSFDESVVLIGANLSLNAGEVHAIVGENGAGKSTFAKICAGIHLPDAGSIFLQGQASHYSSVAEAQALGITLIHQEPRLFPDLTVVENIWIDYRGPGRRFDIRKVVQETKRWLDELGCDLDLDAKIAQTSVADQQLIDIASALRKPLKVLILDEPTASMTPREVVRLAGVLARLKSQGVAIVFIGHRLPEILEISDRITVMRDGEVVGELDTSAASENELANMMVGRDITLSARRSRTSSASEKALVVQNLCVAGVVDDVSLSVERGEILGIGGLVGAGRSELLEAIFGLRPAYAGQVTVNGRIIKKVRDSVEQGVGLVPEDRAKNGLVLDSSVSENIVLASLRELLRWGARDGRAERQLAERMIAELQVKTSSPHSLASSLSGGNQQKLSLAKWLAQSLSVLLVDEPTRGVDVGSKADIHALLRHIANEGVAVVVVSSDMRELLTLPDRILVMRRGRMEGSMLAEQASEEAVISLASGVVQS